jgi:rRNA maturation endonuclease Nob1
MMAQPPSQPVPTKKFRCFACGNVIEVPRGMPKPAICPRCGAPAVAIHRIDRGPPGGRRGGGPPWTQQG